MATLYAAKGGSVASNLYTLDQVTGVATSIGPIGYAVTGLALDPTDGTLYGTTTPNDPVSPKSLITIDTATGAGTLVAVYDSGSGNFFNDICFDAGGQLYGIGGEYFSFIDKTTATSSAPGYPLTPIATTGAGGAYGNGCTFVGATMYGFVRGGPDYTAAPFYRGGYWSINLGTGAGTLVGALAGGPYHDNAAINAAACDPDGLVWAIENDFPACSLVTIDVASGTVTTIAALAGSGWDALEFSEGAPPVPPDNTDAEHAINLTGICSEMAINNGTAPTEPPETDPLAVIYGQTASQQLWYKIVNPSGVRVYARFSFHNPTASNYDILAGLFIGTPGALSDPSNGFISAPWLSFGSDAVWTQDTILAGSDDFFHLGLVLDPGQTVYLEIGGDPSNLDPWNGALVLTWEILDVTFYDGIENQNNLDDGQGERIGPEIAPETYMNPSVSNFLEPYEYIQALGFHWVVSSPTEPYTFASQAAAAAANFTFVDKIDAGTLTRYPLDQGTLQVPMGYDKRTRGATIASDGTDIWVAAVCVENVPNPYYSPGPGGDNVPTWNPYRLIVWRWNGAGFTRLGVIEAQTNNGAGADFGGAYNGIVLCPRGCASSADPGLFHVVWSEEGYKGETLHTGGKWGERTNYSVWDTAGIVSSTEIGNREWPAEDNPPPFSNPRALLMAQAVNNDTGTPVAFFTYGVYEDDTGSDNIVRLVDLSTLTELQQLSGITVQLDPLLPNCWISHAISRPYADPSLGGTEVYYVVVLRTSDSRELVYRVPCDGSAAFDPLDGITGHSITNGFDPTITMILPDGERDIWVPNFGTNPGRISYFDRLCGNIWRDEEPGDDDSVVGDEGVKRPFARGAYLDGDYIYWVGWVDAPGTNGASILKGVYRSKILRDFYICELGECKIVKGIYRVPFTVETLAPFEMETVG